MQGSVRDCVPQWGCKLMRRTGGRPPGSFGEVAQALLRAASSEPAPVRELCQRAQVGYAAGRYTASRLVAQGALQKQGDGRPAVLTVSPAGAGPAGPLEHLQVLHSSFWEGHVTSVDRAAFDLL